MVMSVARFNCIQPGLEPTEMSQRHQAAIAMAEHADDHGFTTITLEEHHGAENGWSPSPMIMASAMLARTTTVSVTISALLVPLHDPIRVAEDLAVLDLISGGRIGIVTGIGYRPSEYKLLDKQWTRRGKLLDQALDVMLAAWSGEPFEYRGEIVQITPTPVSTPHPFVMIGGSSPAAARRAAKRGLAFFPSKNLPELAELYNTELEAHDKTGFCIMPSANQTLNFIAEDPDAAWADLGEYFWNEAKVYQSWQTSDIKSAVKSSATSWQGLRDEGIYRILSPAEAVDELSAAGPMDAFTLHPLCGGMPIAAGWDCMRLYTDEVLPAIAVAT